MKTVLITGVNGFIGTHLADFFNRNNYRVIGWDIKGSLDKEFTVYHVDLVSDDLTSLLGQICPDVIVHCAGLADVSYSIKCPDQDYQANVTSVHRILFAMKENGFVNTVFVQMSSAAVYGQPDVLPITEETKRNPLSPYALHKVMAEDICLYFSKAHDIPVKIPRVFSAYGPGLKKQVFWDMNKKIIETRQLSMFGTGKETRDYIFISDLVQAISLIAFDTSESIIFNVGNGEQIEIESAARLFLSNKDIGADVLSFNGMGREGDPLYWEADITRLLNIGYQKKVSIEEGIEKFVHWAEMEYYG